MYKKGGMPFYNTRRLFFKEAKRRFVVIVKLRRRTRGLSNVQHPELEEDSAGHKKKKTSEKGPRAQTPVGLTLHSL